MEELDKIWNETQYGSKKVISKSKNPECCETPFSDFEDVKDILAKGPKSPFSMSIKKK